VYCVDVGAMAHKTDSNSNSIRENNSPVYRVPAALLHSTMNNNDNYCIQMVEKSLLSLTVYPYKWKIVIKSDITLNISL